MLLFGDIAIVVWCTEGSEGLCWFTTAGDDEILDMVFGGESVEIVTKDIVLPVAPVIIEGLLLAEGLWEYLVLPWGASVSESFAASLVGWYTERNVVCVLERSSGRLVTAWELGIDIMDDPLILWVDLAGLSSRLRCDASVLDDCLVDDRLINSEL